MESIGEDDGVLCVSELMNVCQLVNNTGEYPDKVVLVEQLEIEALEDNAAGSENKYVVRANITIWLGF